MPGPVGGVCALVSDAGVCILLAGSVTTGNLLNLSVPHLLHVDNNSTKLTGLSEASMRQGL